MVVTMTLTMVVAVVVTIMVITLAPIMVTMVVTIISRCQGYWTGVKTQTSCWDGLVSGKGDAADFVRRMPANPNKVLKG